MPVTPAKLKKLAKFKFKKFKLKIKFKKLKAISRMSKYSPKDISIEIWIHSILKISIFSLLVHVGQLAMKVPETL
jgi:hypothetical protein